VKQFAVQAICDEKVLWEVMQALENKRCSGILARPLTNGAAPTRRARPNGITRIDAALEIIRQQSKPMRTSELRDALQEQGFHGQVGGMLHVLLGRKLIRKSGLGKYIAVKK
jgi:hypothetical protein